MNPLCIHNTITNNMKPEQTVPLDFRSAFEYIQQM